MSRAALGAVFLVLVLPALALGQRLPEGDEHRYRERDFDLRHLRAELEVDVSSRSLGGRVSLELVPLRRLEHLAFDAVGLDVSRVTAQGRDLAFEASGGKLEVDLGGAIEPPASFTVEVTYHAEPKAGLYFQDDPRNPELVYVTTYGEGGLHSNWLPIYNEVDDKLTSETIVTVPAPYVVVSNGRLVEESEAADGRRTYHWSQEKPHPSYLIALYVGDFERGELRAGDAGVPLAYWVPRGRLEEGAYAFRNTARMVDYYSRRFDYPYPWVKYDQVAMPDYPIGAMEHTGVTGLNASVLRRPGEAPDDFGAPDFTGYTAWTAEATISHELAHHWFGDNLTCRSLNEIWLNESFASYLMMLWDEESLGEEALDWAVEVARRHYFAYVKTAHLIRPLEYSKYQKPDDMYNTEHTYLKGGAVLHMLRHVLGDDAFFGALSYYLKKHEFENVTSQDLEIAILEKTGKNVGWFFDQWVRGAGHPRFEVSYRHLEARGVIVLEIAQVQPLVSGQGVFRLPVDVVVETAEGRTEETLWVDEAREVFVLPVRSEPLLVSVDGGGHLVAEIDFEKPLEELVTQATHDELAGRLRALTRLAERFPTRRETLETIAAIVRGDGFWALRTEAARLLGEVRTEAARALAEEVLASPDPRLRRAAVLALGRFEGAGERLRRVVREDASTHVAGAALVVLADADPETESAFYLEQLGRTSWTDELRLAALLAFEKLAREDFLPAVRESSRPPHNQDVRQAALAAWEATAAADPELHQALLEAAGGPPYPLQKYALEALGRLAPPGAAALLEEVVAAAADPNLVALARDALQEVRRVEPVP